MRPVLLALCLAGALACALALPTSSTTDSNRADFEAWKVKWDMNFLDATEDDLRFSVWSANLVRVQAHNEENLKGLKSYRLAMNKFAAMTNEEYKRTLTLKASTSNPASETYTPIAAPPDSWDWRNTAGVVNPVKNQEQCGSCWAFSACATMEGAWNLKHLHSPVSLSEQQLVDCVNGGADDCNQGGEMYDGVAYAVKAGGMEDEAHYRYTGESKKVCHFDPIHVVAKFSHYVNVTEGDEAALTSAAYTQPIVSVGIDASHFSFQLYDSGIYDEPKCKHAMKDLDHGVAVIGYGVHGPHDYYLVRNSWGPGWGMGGYILMSRNKKNQCGIATQAMFAEL